MYGWANPTTALKLSAILKFLRFRETCSMETCVEQLYHKL